VRHILLENVKGLRTNKHGNTLQTIVKSLSKLGYDVVIELLNSKDYGIPQNRDRLWIYGYKGTLPLTFNLQPPKERLKVFLKDLLEDEPDPALFKSQEQIERLKELYLLDFIVDEASCADLYNKNIRKDGISITILEPHHNKMRIVHPPKKKQLQVRNYSVVEHFRLMGFKDGEIDFAGQSYQQLCKRAANGWDINIAAKIFTHIFEQLETQD
jgi:DNA (cytosine-5)-methyltransferase 1